MCVDNTGKTPYSVPNYDYEPPSDARGVADYTQENLPTFIRVGIEYGMITPGHDIDEYGLDAVFDPSGFECGAAHNQQGAGAGLKPIDVS